MRLCRFRTLAIIVALTGSTAARAHAQAVPVIQANREIGIAFAPSWISYHEYNSTGAVLDSEHGGVPGIGIEASVVSDTFDIRHLLTKVTYEINTGQTHHRSGTFSYQAPFSSNDVTAEIGKGFLSGSSLLITPAFSFQYREWLRTLPKAELAVQETYTYLAPGAALLASYGISGFVINGKVGLAHMISAENTTVGNPVNNTPDMARPLGARPVWQLALGGDWPITSLIHANIVAGYSHFPFGQSPVAHFGTNGTEYEPPSRTNLGRLSVGLAWGF